VHNVYRQDSLRFFPFSSSHDLKCPCVYFSLGDLIGTEPFPVCTGVCTEVLRCPTQVTVFSFDFLSQHLIPHNTIALCFSLQFALIVAPFSLRTRAPLRNRARARTFPASSVVRPHKHVEACLSTAAVHKGARLIARALLHMHATWQRSREPVASRS
jgi:hypothetical protein